MENCEDEDQLALQFGLDNVCERYKTKVKEEAQERRENPYFDAYFPDEPDIYAQVKNELIKERDGVDENGSTSDSDADEENIDEDNGDDIVTLENEKDDDTGEIYLSIQDVEEQESDETSHCLSLSPY